MKQVLGILTTLVIGYNAHAFEAGALQVNGTACLAPAGSHELIQTPDHPTEFAIPLELYVKRDSGKNMARGTCVFALPIKAKEGHKVIVANVVQLASVRAYGHSNAKVSLEVFQAGSLGEKLEESAIADGATVRRTVILKKADISASTACGGSMTLRGNLSALITGEGKANIYTRPLKLDIVEVPCQND